MQEASPAENVDVAARMWGQKLRNQGMTQLQVLDFTEVGTSNYNTLAQCTYDWQETTSRGYAWGYPYSAFRHIFNDPETARGMSVEVIPENLSWLPDHRNLIKVNEGVRGLPACEKEKEIAAQCRKEWVRKMMKKKRSSQHSLMSRSTTGSSSDSPSSSSSCITPWQNHGASYPYKGLSIKEAEAKWVETQPLLVAEQKAEGSTTDDHLLLYSLPHDIMEDIMYEWRNWEKCKWHDEIGCETCRAAVYRAQATASVGKSNPYLVGVLHNAGLLAEYAVKSIPVKTLPQIWAEHKVLSCDLLKTDVEGMDNDVLRDLCQYFDKWGPAVRPLQIVYEAHSSEWAESEMLCQRLAKYGYEVVSGIRDMDRTQLDDTRGSVVDVCLRLSEAETQVVRRTREVLLQMGVLSQDSSAPPDWSWSWSWSWRWQRVWRWKYRRYGRTCRKRAFRRQRELPQNCRTVWNLPTQCTHW